MAKTRIMIVDDHEVVRLGMRAAFEAEPDQSPALTGLAELV